MSIKRLTLVETTRLAVGAETAVVLEADLNALEAQVRDLQDKLAAAERKREGMHFPDHCELPEAAKKAIREATPEEWAKYFGEQY